MHPILFEIGNFFIGTYGVMIVVGLILALTLAAHLAKKEGQSPDFFYDLAFVVLFAGFMGARFLFVVLNWDDFIDDPWGTLKSRSGFVFLGGLVAGIASAWFFIVLRKMPKWEVADIVAPALALGHAFGRIGCVFAGCCYGKVLSDDNPVALQFPRVFNAKGEEIFGFAVNEHIHRGLIPPDAMLSAPVFPSQIAEAIVNFGLTAALLFLWTRRKFQGQIFIAYLFLYGIARFLLEYMRGDLERGVFFNGLISTSQMLSLGIIAFGGILWYFLGRREDLVIDPNVPVPAPETEEPAPKKTKKNSPNKSGKKKKKKR